MNTYIIERNINGVGNMSAAEYCDAAQRSNMVLDELAPAVQWVQSFATTDKLYCVYRAKHAEAIQTHAERSGFPAHRVSKVSAVLDPTTAN